MRKNLKRFLIERGMRQGKLCEDLGICQTHLSLVINGKRGASKKIMNKFKEIYGIETYDEVYEIFKDE